MALASSMVSKSALSSAASVSASLRVFPWWIEAYTMALDGFEFLVSPVSLIPGTSTDELIQFKFCSEWHRIWTMKGGGRFERRLCKSQVGPE